MTNTYPSTIRFQSTDLRIIDHRGRPWLTGADLARALGYEHAYSVSNLYQRNKGEFSCEMSDTTKLMGSGNLRSTTRIYSPRGCHLVAMLARTDKAKAFRRWVLDALEGMEQARNPEHTELMVSKPAAPTPGLRELIAHRDRFLRRGNLVVEVDNLARAVRQYPGHTSAELAVILQIKRSDMARLVITAEQDGWIKRGPGRYCAIGCRDSLTWESTGPLSALRYPPSLPNYGFERFIRACRLPSPVHRAPREPAIERGLGIILPGVS